MRKSRHITAENQWNRLARNLIYDAKQVLLYNGIHLPSLQGQDVETLYRPYLKKITRGADYGAIYDPTAQSVHFEPDYIQDILDTATRFDFPVFDRSFGPGGTAGFIHRQQGDTVELISPSLNSILQQAMLAENSEMPFGFVSARRLDRFEVEQVNVIKQVFKGPAYLSVRTEEGFQEVLRANEEGHYIITTHSVLISPLTLGDRQSLDIFFKCVEHKLPVMLVTQPFSGHTAPMTTYGTALMAFAEFMAGMAMAAGMDPETTVINGAYPTMCTPGSRPQLKIGSVVHNFTNYLLAYTSRLLDIASIQSGCTVEGELHEQSILETDYDTVRGMILWDNLFEGWHMVRHCYGFLNDLASFSFPKAEHDIAALHHIQSLDENGITAVLANNVRLHSDYKRAEGIYNSPQRLFQREKDTLLEVIIETMEHFGSDFGKHDHTLKNVPERWF